MLPLPKGYSMGKILTFELIAPFWVSFRNPSTINVHITYPFPPLTTIYGLLNAARGKPQDWHDDRQDWQISLAVSSKGELVETYSKIMKIARTDSGSQNIFDPTPIIRQKLVGASYCVYLKAEEDLLVEAKQALDDPFWPLYLGESDDAVDVVNSQILMANQKS